MTLSRINVITLIQNKDRQVYCIRMDASIEAAVEEMNRLRVGSLLVEDGSNQVVGIFTERDVLVRVVASGKDPATTSVEEVMTSDFLSIDPGCSVEQAMQMMTEHRVRHLPIMEDGTLRGMVSIGDVTRWLLEINEMEAENLRRYVFSDYPG
ncbi:MAG: CBS domain-containing protein [Coraliomargaritaceae bacterium]